MANRNKDKTMLEKALADGRSDTVSSKRGIMLASGAVLIIGFFLSCFGFSPQPEFVYIFGSIVLGEGGFCTAEKISKYKRMSKRVEAEEFEDDEECDV